MLIFILEIIKFQILDINVLSIFFSIFYLKLFRARPVHYLRGQESTRKELLREMDEIDKDEKRLQLRKAKFNWLKTEIKLVRESRVKINERQCELTNDRLDVCKIICNVMFKFYFIKNSKNS